jgi:hypothetical protein
MRTKEEINAEYTRLCMLVGEMAYKIRQLEEAKNNHLRRIELLEEESRHVVVEKNNGT